MWVCAARICLDSLPDHHQACAAQGRRTVVVGPSFWCLGKSMRYVRWLHKFIRLLLTSLRSYSDARQAPVNAVISVRQPSNGRLSTKYVLLFRFKNTCATRRPSGPSTCPIFVRLERRVNFRRRCDLTASARCLQPRCAPFHLPKLCVLQPAQRPRLPGRSHRVIRLEHLLTPCYLFDL